MNKQDLKATEYNDYYAKYIKLGPDNTSLKESFKADKKMVIDFFSSIPEEKLTYRYQPQKWSIKEVLQHIIDTERIFMYRFLCVARQDKTPLAGFDQDIYIEPSGANIKTIDQLLHEFTVTRLYSINLIESISEENLKNIGTASDSPISPRACAYILLGHSIWHINSIKNLYL